MLFLRRRPVCSISVHEATGIARCLCPRRLRHVWWQFLEKSTPIPSIPERGLVAGCGPWLKPPWPTGGSVYWGPAAMGSTLAAGRAQCKPADRFDCYGALRQLEKLQAQARGATMAPPASTAGRRLRLALRGQQIFKAADSCVAISARSVLAFAAAVSARRSRWARGRADCVWTGLPKRADRILRTVRSAVSKYQRLLEAEYVRRVIGPGRKCFGLNLVEPSIVVEHGSFRVAAVRPCKAHLPTVHAVHALRDIVLHLATLRQDCSNLSPKKVLACDPPNKSSCLSSYPAWRAIALPASFQSSCNPIALTSGAQRARSSSMKRRNLSGSESVSGSKPDSISSRW